MAYGTVADAAALVPGGGALNESSTPTDAQALNWMHEGAAIIDRYLAGAGYAIPAPSTAAARYELAALNNLYTAAQILAARGMDTVQGETENRSEVMLNRFFEQLRELAASNLAALGLTPATTNGVPVSRLRTRQLRRVDGYSYADGWTE